jgi:hypothetical protein
MLERPILILMTISLFLVFVGPILLKLASDALDDFNEQRKAIDAFSNKDR